MREIKFDFIYNGEHGFHHKTYHLHELVHGTIIHTSELVATRQYTGLKDKNGVEIYEGDIVRYKAYHNLGHKREFSVDLVEWGETGDSDDWAHSKHYEWVAGDDSLADVADSNFPDEAEAEIVGNIYENPELLEG